MARRRGMGRVANFLFREINEDIFSCGETSSMAHCISADCKLGKGIALTFRNLYGGIETLKRQRKNKGDVAILRIGENRFIYNLVTKQKYFQKPTYDDLKMSLQAMREHCRTYHVKELAMPRIGCGLDKLQWPRVKNIITLIFQDTDIEITVYCPEAIDNRAGPNPRSCWDHDRPAITEHNQREIVWSRDDNRVGPNPRSRWDHDRPVITERNQREIVWSRDDNRVGPNPRSRWDHDRPVITEHNQREIVCSGDDKSFDRPSNRRKGPCLEIKDRVTTSGTRNLEVPRNNGISGPRETSSRGNVRAHSGPSNEQSHRPSDASHSGENKRKREEHVEPETSKGKQGTTSVPTKKIKLKRCWCP